VLASVFNGVDNTAVFGAVLVCAQEGGIFFGFAESA
jgi:hypothetical protein